MSMIFEGTFNGTTSDCEKLKNIILKENASGGFIRVSFDMTHNQYFDRSKETFKGIARIRNNNIVSFYKTIKSGKSLNIHLVNIVNIKLLPFTKQDKINWEL